jgi:hypothetical protein
MTAVTHRDPGPLARLEAVKADPNTALTVFHRVADGETLKSIAKSWEVPRGAFALWFTTEHAALYEAALKVRADELAHEALDISDEQAEVVKKDGTTFDPDVARDKLRVDTRLKLAGVWDRARYGAKDSGPAGGLTVVVDRSCGGSVQIEAPGGSKVVVGNSGAEALGAEVRETAEEGAI